MIITDWYMDSSNPNESIKITIRFLTNEIRSDSLSIKTFKMCKNINECLVSEKGKVITRTKNGNSKISDQI